MTTNNTNKKSARLTGLLYLFMAITGAFSMMYVPSVIIAPGDAAATMKNLTAFEALFRMGIVSGLACQVAFLFLVLALYRLFEEVNRTQARLMVTLVVASVPVAFLNILSQFGALFASSGVDFLKGFSSDQLQALAMLFLNVYEHGVIIVGIFWGLWLLIMGVKERNPAAGAAG